MQTGWPFVFGRPRHRPPHGWGTSYRSPWHMCHTGRSGRASRPDGQNREARMIRKLLLVAVLVGCGGSGGEPGDIPPPGNPAAALMVGNWISTINTSCAAAFDATATDFAFGLICVNADSSIDLQVQKGTWSLTGSSLVLNNEQATCTGTARQDLETATVTATSLILTD